VIPIHKKGAHNNPENYRPISVLLVLSKVLERALHQQLSEFLKEQNLLTKYQFGYRSNRSTNLAATLFLDDIRREVDVGNMVGAVFIDLSKAFDTLGHSVLLGNTPYLRMVSMTMNFYGSLTIYLGATVCPVRERHLEHAINIQWSTSRINFGTAAVQPVF
jgi:hypothetical protein